MDRAGYATVLGVGACLAGVAGYLAFGWRFGGSSAPFTGVVALAAAGLAAALAAARLLAD